MRFHVAFLALPLALACHASDPSSAASRARHGALETPMDPHSHSEPNRVRVTHVSLELELDFGRHSVRGAATLAFERPDPSAPLILDQQGLAIAAVRGADGSARKFQVGAEAGGLGSALTIQLAPADKSVRVEYATGERADALQWLAPEQTSDKRRPFLFTQGQAVLTRTWIPIQDTPGVRVTYDAKVRAPEGAIVVMSAEQLARGADGSFSFRMQHPIPCYLIALACGEIEFRSVSERCGVWAEPSVVDGARAELSDMEAMVARAEQLFGPYRWGRYDLIILPPSFPYGGMENPMMTFATPTILAGDKSLVSLVAHELAHSWSGNLVTNATWRDFWLNEGFTVYFEQRIMEAVFGRERAQMEKQLALAELEREMKELKPLDTVLHIDLEGRHPDDGFSGVPYNKGAAFLQRLEELLGRPRLDRFLTRWFDEHAFESVTHATFVAYLQQELAPSGVKLDLHAWFDEPGLPSDTPRPTSALLAGVDQQIARFQSGVAPAELDTRGWVTQQWLHFLEGLGSALTADSMRALDAVQHFTDSGNSEILGVWLRLSIEKGYAPADAALERFLMNVGRRKFLKPLYQELAKTPAGRERALKIYARARPRYHAVSTKTLDELLHWRGP
jgi:leukotriene-A4 hydrolase